MIWHDLDEFAPGSVVLVVASTHYDEAEYIRNYDVFLEEIARLASSEGQPGKAPSR